MKSPEMNTHNDFDALLDDEIARVQGMENPVPPENKYPLSLEEYRELTKNRIKMPTDEQMDNFIYDFENDRAIMQFSKPGYKLVPVLMPHDHGYPEFERGRIEHYGYLYYYVLDKDNLTVRTNNLAYMDAVLPMEIINNGVVVPEDFRRLDKFRELQANFKESVKKLLELVK